MSNINAFRYIRLKLKTGFLKTEPPEYRYLIKYPPLQRDTAPPLYDLKPNRIPYLDLYQKIVKNDPVMREESVYPAYWQEEPIAMTMAKKQYQLIKEGLSEENAYEEALKYVNQIESTAYEKLISFLNKIKDNNVKSSIFSNPKISKKYNELTNMLLNTSYDELSDADQGEIDYFIQNDVLKWGEVERTRRMIDPVFVWQFEKLRNELFPNSFNSNYENMLYQREELKNNFLQSFELDHTLIKPNSSFFYEDYYKLFYQLREKPYLVRWNERNKEILSQWIIDTLILKFELNSENPEDIQETIDLARSNFFPMIKYPELALTFQLPDVKTIRNILYKNEIGYKNENNKLFIQRFYKLPPLLFPKETWLTRILKNQTKLSKLLENRDLLVNEIKVAGFTDNDINELETKLRNYSSSTAYGIHLQSDISINNSGLTSGISSLDALLQNNEEENPFLNDYENDNDNDENDESFTDEELKLIDEINANFEEENDDDENIDESKYLAEIDEVNEMKEKLFPKPTTKLEEDRMIYFNSLTDTEDLYESKTGYDFMDLKELKSVKITTDVIQSARFKLEFERKNAARIQRDWKKRGLLTDELPEPEIELLDK